MHVNRKLNLSGLNTMIEYHLVKLGSIFWLGGVLTMLRSAHPQDPQTYDLYPTLFIHWYISNVKSKDMSTIYPIPYRKKNPFECGMNIVGKVNQTVYFVEEKGYNKPRTCILKTFHQFALSKLFQHMVYIFAPKRDKLNILKLFGKNHFIFVTWLI